MPTITLSKKALLAEVGKLSDKKLKERISMLGTDLEGIDGDEISVEIFPNRPDLLSQQGFNRAMSSFLGKRTGLRHYGAAPPTKRVNVEESVKECRPYTSCAIVTGLTITEERLKELITIQEKLHVTYGRNRKRMAIGIYPIEQIAFPVTFTGLKPSEIRFTPLEATRELTAREILEEHPKGKAYAHLLKGLRRYACFVDAQGRIMSMTPIINSALTGKITTATTSVFIECSGFDQRILDEGLAMIVTALADMGGAIESVTVAYPDGERVTPALEPRRMTINRTYLNNLLGLSLSEQELASCLERMGFGYEEKKEAKRASEEGTVLIPPYRTDILHQADLAEDVAIAYGYERIPESLPNIATEGEEDEQARLAAAVRALLVGHGLLECKNYHLLNSRLQARFGLKPIRVDHPVSQEYDSLRASLLPGLLETLRRNKRHEYPQQLFEIGRVFEPGTLREGERLAVVLCGEKADYTAIRQLLDDLLTKLGVEATYAAAKHPVFIPGRGARVTIGKSIAIIGEVAPAILDAFELTMPVAAFELEKLKK